MTSRLLIHVPDDLDLESARDRIIADSEALYASTLTLPKSGKPEEGLRLAYAQNASFRAFGHDVDDGTEVWVSEFWQSSLSVLHHIPQSPIQRMTVTKGITHPIRPEFSGLLYRRRIKDEIFSLRCAAESDVEKLMEWHNSDRVNAFWGERGDVEHHRTYLTRQIEDKHVTPVIGSFGDQRFGYFELYYAKEDNIGTFASASDYDVGFHALIGEQAFRGPERVRAWVLSITHHLFLNDPRTQRVMLEPRVDNAKFIAYLEKYGYVREKDFNFPHKRAALMVITRQKFFEVMYGPLYQASSSSI